MLGGPCAYFARTMVTVCTKNDVRVSYWPTRSCLHAYQVPGEQEAGYSVLLVEQADRPTARRTSTIAVQTCTVILASPSMRVYSLLAAYFPLWNCYSQPRLRRAWQAVSSVWCGMRDSGAWYARTPMGLLLLWTKNQGFRLRRTQHSRNRTEECKMTG